MPALTPIWPRTREALDLPGIELAVVRDGRLEHLTALGTSGNHDQPLTPQTPVLLASLSKSLTAVAVMQLVESGVLALDAPVVRYLPWFTTRDRAMSATITVAQHAAPDQRAAGARSIRNQAAHRHQPRRVGERRPGDESDRPAVPARDEVDLLQRQLPNSRSAGADHLGSAVRPVHDTACLRTGGHAPQLRRESARRCRRGIRRPLSLVRTQVPGDTLDRRATRPGTGRDDVELCGGPRPTSDPEHEPGRVGGRSVLAPSAVAEMHRPAAEVNVANSYTMGWYMRPAWEQSSTKMFGENYQLPFVWEHGGSWNTTSTYLGFIPSQQLGIVVLINGNNPPAESALGNIHTNIWHLLAGTPTEPAIPNEPLLLRYGSVLALAIVALLVVSLLWSVRELKRRRQVRAGQPASTSAFDRPTATD